MRGEKRGGEGMLRRGKRGDEGKKRGRKEVSKGKRGDEGK